MSDYKQKIEDVNMALEKKSVEMPMVSSSFIMKCLIH